MPLCVCVAPNFWPMFIAVKGWMDKDGSWYRGRPQSKAFCVRLEPCPVRKKGRSPRRQFMPIFIEVRLRPGDVVLHGDPVPPSEKGRNHQFSAKEYCGQTAAWIKMPLATYVIFGLRDIVLDGDPAPPPLKGHSRRFSAVVLCCQTAAWTKMPLGMEVGFGPGDLCSIGTQQP